MSARPEIRLCRHSSSRNAAVSSLLRQLTAALGTSVVDLQHIGSTAVRGILAVPVIDIAVGLSEEANIADVIDRLARIGFRRMPADETGCVRLSRKHFRHFFETSRLYITRHDSKSFQDLIAFRNYLNTHVLAANEYEELKTALSEKFRYDPLSYAAGKAQFIRNILRLCFTDPFLGHHLTIVIDRPLGSPCPTNPETQYELNFGFVPGIPTPDGGNLGAYIYGVKKPMRRFTGTVIAVIHRKDGDEDMLVVAPSGTVAYEPMIRDAVQFAERQFDTSVICIYEKSCGAILYRINAEGIIEYLILHQHRSGTWSVPKGHIAAGETETETALREIREETGLSVTLTPGFRRELSYTVSAKASKNVVIFLAEANGKLSLGENEISEAIWADKATAIRRLGGRSIGRIIESAETFINSRRTKETPPPA